MRRALLFFALVCALAIGVVAQYTPPGGSVTATTTASGPIASLPASSATAGNVYISTDSPYQFVWNGTSWDSYVFGFKVVQPVLGNFTQVNVDHSTFDTTHGGIVMTISNAAGHDVQVLATAKGTGHYFVDACWINLAGGTNGGVGTGLSGGTAISNGLSFVGASFGNTGYGGMVRYLYTSTTAFVNLAGGNTFFSTSPLLCSRIEDDGTTNRTTYVSNNLYTWSLIQQEARTTSYTPANAVFAATPFSSIYQLHLVHWSVHN